MLAGLLAAAVLVCQTPLGLLHAAPGTARLDCMLQGAFQAELGHVPASGEPTEAGCLVGTLDSKPHPDLHSPVVLAVPVAQVPPATSLLFSPLPEGPAALAPCALHRTSLQNQAVLIRI